MTQVVTVSANTAAYAMEALKPAARVARKKFVEDIARTIEASANDIAPEDVSALNEMIKTASAELAMMNSGDHPPQATIKEAIDAYRRAGA